MYLPKCLRLKGLSERRLHETSVNTTGGAFDKKLVLEYVKLISAPQKALATEYKSFLVSKSNRRHSALKGGYKEFQITEHFK